MIDWRANYVEAYNLDEAWRETLWLCARNGYDYFVKKGSFEGEIRRQLEYLVVVVLNPSQRPLAPQIPPGVPPPTSDQKIEQIYFPEYLLNPKLLSTEQYRYSTWIVPQLPKIIEKLKRYKEGTNQATIAIGDIDSVNLSDPPCLRVLDFKIVEEKLNLSCYFRSWDLYSGFPENLGGLQLLKEYVLSEIGEVEDGKLIAYSSGAHIKCGKNKVEKIKRKNLNKWRMPGVFALFLILW